MAVIINYKDRKIEEAEASLQVKEILEEVLNLDPKDMFIGVVEADGSKTLFDSGMSTENKSYFNLLMQSYIMEDFLPPEHIHFEAEDEE